MPLPALMRILVRPRHRPGAGLVLALAAGLLAACKPAAPPPPPPPPPAQAIRGLQPASGIVVGELLLGRELGPDGEIVEAADSYSPQDTLYVVIHTMGDGAARLSARWLRLTPEGSELVQEEARQIDADGPGTVEFHARPAQGWLRGEYRVEIGIDGEPAGRLRFSVH